MAPPHKFLYMRMMGDDGFEVVRTTPPDLDDVLPVMYHRIRGYLRDSCLDVEQKRSAIANCVNRSAESLGTPEDDLRRSLEQFVATTAPLDPDNILSCIVYHAPNNKKSPLRDAPASVGDSVRERHPAVAAPRDAPLFVNIDSFDGQGDSSESIDDLSGRPSLGSGCSTKKHNNTDYQTFTISDLVLMYTKLQLRSEKDPNSNSFMVLNFRRLAKEPKQGGAAKGKAYDFNIYEYLAGRLLTAILVFMGDRTPGEIEFPAFNDLPVIDHDGKRSVNMSKWGQDKYNMGSYAINNDIRAFMVEQFGGWQLIIRKYKQRVKVSEKPHFEFNIPAEDMPKVAASLRYIFMRELGTEPNLETDSDLAPYKNVDAVRRIMTPKLVKAAPSPSSANDNNADRRLHNTTVDYNNNDNNGDLEVQQKKRRMVD